MLTILLIIGRSNAGEQKPKYARAWCGDDFIRAWRTICLIKSRRGRRSVTDTLRTADSPTEPNMFKKTVLKVKQARNFLKPHSRVRRQYIAAATDDADEECCKERCTMGEVAGYKC